MTGEGRGLRFLSLSRIADGPAAGVGSIQNDEVQLRLRHGDGRCREAQNLRLRERRCHERVIAGRGFSVLRLDGHGVLCAGDKTGEGKVCLCLEALVELVSVGVGADNLERAFLFAGIDLHGQIVRAGVHKGDLVDVQIAGRNDEEVDRRADAGNQQQAAQRDGKPAALFAALFGRAGIIQRCVVFFIRLQRPGDAIALRVLLRFFMDRVDERVEHLRVRREVLLEILGQRIGVCKLHRLNFFLLRQIDRLVLTRDRGNNQRVVDLVALHVLDQCVLQFLRALVAVGRLEGTRLENDFGNLVVRVHRNRERLAGDSAAIRCLRGRVFVLKGRVVAVENPV